jgi:hypothetical protein
MNSLRSDSDRNKSQDRDSSMSREIENIKNDARKLALLSARHNAQNGRYVFANEALGKKKERR